MSELVPFEVKIALTKAEIDALKTEAILDFVERVEARLPGYNTGKGAESWLKAYRLAVYDELAEMGLKAK